MRIYLISDNVDTRTGLRLVGVDGGMAHTADELARELEKALSDKEIGIVIVTEKLSQYFPEMIKAFREAHPMPLLVEIPDRHGTGRPKDYLSEYVREAVGVKLD